jgi:hypothetical protein
MADPELVRIMNEQTLQIAEALTEAKPAGPVLVTFDQPPVDEGADQGGKGPSDA